MKIYALVIMAMVAMAGCSTSYKGSIQGSNSPDASKNSSYVVSQAGTSQYGVEAGK